MRLQTIPNPFEDPLDLPRILAYELFLSVHFGAPASGDHAEHSGPAAWRAADVGLPGWRQVFGTSKIFSLKRRATQAI